MDEDDTIPELEIDTGLAHELQQAQAHYLESRRIYEEAKAKAIAACDGYEKVQATSGGSPVFTFSSYTTTRMNTSRLKRDYPTIYDAYLVESKAQRITMAKEKS